MERSKEKKLHSIKRCSWRFSFFFINFFHRSFFLFLYIFLYKKKEITKMLFLHFGMRAQLALDLGFPRASSQQFSFFPLVDSLYSRTNRYRFLSIRGRKRERCTRLTPDRDFKNDDDARVTHTPLRYAECRFLWPFLSPAYLILQWSRRWVCIDASSTKSRLISCISSFLPLREKTSVKINYTMCFEMTRTF